MALAVTGPSNPSAYWLTSMLFIYFFGMAWVDTIVGGLIVKESRRDKEKGAYDMRYYQWITWGFGGIIPPLLGPFMMYQQRDWPIAYCYYVLTGISFMFLVAAPFIPTDANALERQKEGHGFKKYVSLQI